MLVRVVNPQSEIADSGALAQDGETEFGKRELRKASRLNDRSMNYDVNRRAKIAFRSLGPEEQRRVERIFRKIAASDVGNWRQILSADRLKAVSDEDLYVLKSSPEMRVLIKNLGSALMVEDIMPYERLGHSPRQ